MKTLIDQEHKVNIQLSDIVKLPCLVLLSLSEA